MNISPLIPELIALAQNAATTILEIYKQNNFLINYKTDGSPVTEADLAANEIIIQGLKELSPNIPIMSEELPETPLEIRKNWQQFWCIDPLDGTRQFIKRTGQFTINIALIENHYPVFGLIYVPTTGTCYFAHESIGAFKQIHHNPAVPIHVRNLPPKPSVLISHRQNIATARARLTMFSDFEVMAVSSALKYGLVAEGITDIFPCLGATCEWDTAAGQCIVECAGGKIINFAAQRLPYNVKSSLINPHFWVLGDYESLLPLILKQ